jgi:hypothetical protein
VVVAWCGAGDWQPRMLWLPANTESATVAALVYPISLPAPASQVTIYGWSIRRCACDMSAPMMLALNVIFVFLFGCPLARWVDRFSDLKRHVVGVVHHVANDEDGGGPLEVQISQFVG